MKTYVFKVRIEEDAFVDGRNASCPALKGCHTWGHTYDEALANIKEAIELYVEDLIESGQPVPVGPDQGVVEMDSPAVVVNR